MCGISGFNKTDTAAIQSMVSAIAHRGPDRVRTWVGEGVSLGHNRLSIIDLSESADQPMRTPDGRYTIVYNGELYNFQDIKKELTEEYSFQTNSDTEVILAAYAAWGAECLDRFNGMFAFAIWDEKEQTLFLARDQIGIKPLYYFWDGKRFIFSSEIKAILTHDVERKIDMDAFNHYLRVLYVPEPLTMFRGIKKLPPGTYATLTGGNLSLTEYWKPSRVLTDAPMSELSTALRGIVRGAVKRQLVSDRPVGVYLSGGIDSSVVLDGMAHCRGEIDTFSVGFDLAPEEGREKFNRDFVLAKKTAAQYGTRHHEVMVSAEDVVELLPKVIWHTDEPISKSTSIAMMKIAHHAKETVDVVLGGDGGDELFGGYDRYRLSLMASTYQKLPASMRTLLSNYPRFKKLNTPSGIDRYALFMFQKNTTLKRVIRSEYFDTIGIHDFFAQKYFDGSDNQPFESKMMEVDRKSWLPDDSLVLSDKMTMSAGLEERVPLLDRAVVEFALQVPQSKKVDLFRTKKVLKEAFRGHIPDFLFQEPKRGWYAPGAKWLRRPAVSALAKEVLSRDYYAPTADLFDWDALRAMLEDHQEKNGYHLTILWAVLTFQLWARTFDVSR